MNITDYIAIYGAILSTFLAIYEVIKNNRKIKITCKIAVVGVSSYKTVTCLAIDVVNVGQRPITITQAGLLMSDKQVFTQVATEAGLNPLPKLLNDGERLSILLDYKISQQVIEGLNIKYKFAFVTDAEGRIYKAKLPKNFGR